MKKKILIILAVLLFCQQVFAIYTTNDITWDGIIKIDVDKTSFSSDENITGKAYINNIEDYPLIGGRLILNISEGAYNYPSQFAKDNILSEYSIDNIWVLPNSQKEISFSIPNINGGGNYRVDAYFWVLKSKMVGSSSILFGPISKNFSINSNPIKKVVIQRDKTFFGENIIGPQGFPSKPLSEFSGKVFIKNEANYEKKNLVLLVSTCDWASAFCKTSEKTKITIGNIKSGEEKEIEVKMISPKIPSAYEINLELLSNEGTESIYKSRIIVTGGTAKLRKIFMNGLRDENYSFNITFTGSPDHFTKPKFENFDITLEIFSSNKSLEKYNEKIDKIDTDELISKFFKIDSKDFDKACATIMKDGEIYEQECFDIDLNSIRAAYKSKYPTVVKVKWNYDEKNNLLKVDLEKKIINSRIIILFGDETIVEDNFSEEINSITRSYTVPKETLILIVDDFDAKKQQVIELLLNKKTDLSKTSEIDENLRKSNCTGIICESGYVCNQKTYESIQGNCCTGTCVEETKFGDVEKMIPLITIIAFILLIVSIFFVSNTYKKVKK